MIQSLNIVRSNVKTRITIVVVNNVSIGISSSGSSILEPGETTVYVCSCLEQSDGASQNIWTGFVFEGTLELLRCPLTVPVFFCLNSRFRFGLSLWFNMENNKATIKRWVP